METFASSSISSDGSPPLFLPQDERRPPTSRFTEERSEVLEDPRTNRGTRNYGIVRAESLIPLRLRAPGSVQSEDNEAEKSGERRPRGKRGKKIERRKCDRPLRDWNTGISMRKGTVVGGGRAPSPLQPLSSFLFLGGNARDGGLYSSFFARVVFSFTAFSTLHLEQTRFY